MKKEKYKDKEEMQRKVNFKAEIRFSCGFDNAVRCNGSHFIALAKIFFFHNS